MNEEDVTKIVGMIDDEIISLIPEWKSRLHLDESDSYSRNCSLKDSFINCPSPKNTEFLQIHSQFEKDSNQFVTEGAPVGSTVPSHENAPFEEQRPGKDESNVNKDTKSQTNLMCHELPSKDQDKDYEKEIRQELRWLKAKYEIRLRALRDRKMGASSKSWAVEYSKNGMKKDESNDEPLVLNSFEPDKKWVNPRTRNYELGGGACGPVYMVVGKSFYGNTLLVP